MARSGELFEKLVDVIARLRDPVSGCPWDREQTHATLRQYLIEEAYEVIDAIDHTPAKIPEELGDVLLQVVLHSQIGRDEKRFSIDDVVTALTEKLVVRHPHVFGEVKAETSREVLENWEQIKRTERPARTGMLDGIPRSMPALLRCHRIGEKVGRVGFDWDTPADIAAKISEEVGEFLTEARQTPADPTRLEEELGDVLFTVAQLARKLGLNAETVLQGANEKFARRFGKLERLAGDVDLKTLGRERLEALWQEVKRIGEG